MYKDILMFCTPAELSSSLKRCSRSSGRLKLLHLGWHLRVGVSAFISLGLKICILDNTVLAETLIGGACVVAVNSQTGSSADTTQDSENYLFCSSRFFLPPWRGSVFLVSVFVCLSAKQRVLRLYITFFGNIGRTWVFLVIIIAILQSKSNLIL